MILFCTNIFVVVLKFLNNLWTPGIQKYPLLIERIMWNTHINGVS